MSSNRALKGYHVQAIKKKRVLTKVDQRMFKLVRSFLALIMWKKNQKSQISYHRENTCEEQTVSKLYQMLFEKVWGEARSHDILIFIIISYTSLLCWKCTTEIYLIMLSPKNANSINYYPSTVEARIQTQMLPSLTRFTVILTWPRMSNYHLCPIRGPELVARNIITSRDYTIFWNVRPGPCPNRPPSWIKVSLKRKKEGFGPRADTIITWATTTHPQHLSMKECSGQKVLIVKQSQNDPLDSPSQKNWPGGQRDQGMG